MGVFRGAESISGVKISFYVFDTPILLEFARTMATHGLQARTRTTGDRWRCKPHQSVMDHLVEAYTKMNHSSVFMTCVDM